VRPRIWQPACIGLIALAALVSGCSSGGSSSGTSSGSGSHPTTSAASLPVDPIDRKVCTEFQRFVDSVNRRDVRGQAFFLGGVGSAARNALDSSLRRDGLAFATHLRTDQRTAQAAAKSLVQECKRLGIPIKRVHL
jgi:hypothetical protein